MLPADGRQVEFLWCKGGGETAVCVELVMQIWGKTAVRKRNSCATQGESTGNSRGAKEGDSRGAMGENCAIYTWELLVVQRGKTADCCTQREFLWRKRGNPRNTAGLRVVQTAVCVGNYCCAK